LERDFLVLVLELFALGFEFGQLFRQSNFQELGQEPLRRATDSRGVPIFGGDLKEEKSKKKSAQNVNERRQDRAR
jgi:hypothetical protein